MGIRQVREICERFEISQDVSSYMTKAEIEYKCLDPIQANIFTQFGL